MNIMTVCAIPYVYIYICVYTGEGRGLEGRGGGGGDGIREIFGIMITLSVLFWDFLSLYCLSVVVNHCEW